MNPVKVSCPSSPHCDIYLLSPWDKIFRDSLTLSPIWFSNLCIFSPQKLGHDCQLAGQGQTQKGVEHVQNVLYDLLPCSIKIIICSLIPDSWLQDVPVQVQVQTGTRSRCGIAIATHLWNKFAVFSEIHCSERSSSKAGCCRWLKEVFNGACRASPGDPGRGGQWHKSWWVGRDGTLKAATAIKHYWGSEVIEGQINKAAQSSLREGIHRKALTESRAV